MLNVNNLNAAAKLLNQTNLLNGTKVSSNDVQQAVSISVLLTQTQQHQSTQQMQNNFFQTQYLQQNKMAKMMENLHLAKQ